VGFGSFRTDWLEVEKGGGLSTALRWGLKCGSWESKFGGDLDPSTGVEWVGLVCAWGTSEACVFGVPNWATLIRELPFLRDGTTWLWSSTVIRTRIWKMVKMVLITQLLLESRTSAYIE
jgi:hypothetical protein